MSSPTFTGIVNDLPEHEYHARTELSSTEARILVKPGGPRRYRWAKDHPPLIEPSRKYDIGTAIHTKVLGTGSLVRIIPDEILAKNGAISTTAAKEFVETARAEGAIALTAAQAEPTEQAAEAVLANPTARAIFTQPGNPEASVFATDPLTGVALRARYDFLPDLTLDRPIAADLKSTAREATPSSFGKAAAEYQYDVQEEHYLYTTRHAGVVGNLPQFAFVVVEKSAPYLVAVLQLPLQLRERGERRARRAREIYAECMRTNNWPGLDPEPKFVDVPPWALYDDEDAA